MTKTNTKAGFSLVELMVVVAIIGILATIAVPNFQKFQAKAKQSSAKSELTGIYTAEKAFYAEYNQFGANLCGVGYVPDGIVSSTGAITGGVQRNYRTGFATITSGAKPAAITNVANCANAWTSDVTSAAGVTHYIANTPASQAGALDDAPSTGAVSLVAFTAGATGQISSSSILDVWTIDDSKALLNATAGL
jgi:type IV pilus assembly protein PilA